MKNTKKVTAASLKNNKETLKAFELVISALLDEAIANHDAVTTRLASELVNVKNRYEENYDKNLDKFLSDFRAMNDNDKTAEIMQLILKG